MDVAERAVEGQAWVKSGQTPLREFAKFVNLPRIYRTHPNRATGPCQRAGVARDHPGRTAPPVATTVLAVDPPLDPTFMPAIPRHTTQGQS
jgi:hypothetical protein